MSLTNGPSSPTNTIPDAPDPDSSTPSPTTLLDQTVYEDTMAAQLGSSLDNLEAGPAQEIASPTRDPEGAAFAITPYESVEAAQMVVPGNNRTLSSSSGHTSSSSSIASTTGNIHHSVAVDVDSTIGIDEDRLSHRGRAIDVTDMDEWPSLEGEVVEDPLWLPVPPLTHQALQLNSPGNGRASPTTTAASTIGSSNASNPSETRQINSMASILSAGDLRDPTHGPDRFQPLTDAWDSYQHVVSFEDGPVGDDRVPTAEGSHVWYNSHTENITRILHPSRVIHDTFLNPYEVIRIPRTHRIGPAFDATAFQEYVPVSQARYTNVDQFARDMEFGLWHLTPRTMLPLPRPADMQALSPDRIAAALRNCHDEFQLTLDFYYMSKVIEMSSLEYEGDWDINLECGICRMPLVEPRITPCEHTFCADCLHRALLDRLECPQCRRSMSEAVCIIPTKIVMNMLNEMKVHCPLRNRGCQRIISRSDVPEHVKRHCGYLLIACPSNRYRESYQRRQRCTILLPRKDVRGDTCRHKIIACEYCTFFSCPEINLADHVRTECPNYEITCTHCTLLFPRKVFDAHVTECAHKLTPCKAIAYGCDFLGAADARKEHEAACPLVKLMPWLRKQEVATKKLVDVQGELVEAQRELKDTIDQYEKPMEKIERILHDNQLD